MVRLPELSIDEESLEVVVGVLEDDGAVTIVTTLEHLNMVPEPIMHVGHVRIVGCRIANLRTTPIFGEGVHEGVGFSAVPAVCEHTRAGVLRILGELLDRTRRTASVLEIAVFEIRFHDAIARIDAVRGDGLAIEVY